MKAERQLLTEAEAAQAFGVCTKTFVARIVKQRRLDFILIGRSRYYDPTDLESFKTSEKRKWLSDDARARRSSSTTSQLGVVDIEDLRAKRRKPKQ